MKAASQSPARSPSATPSPPSSRGPNERTVLLTPPPNPYDSDASDTAVPASEAQQRERSGTITSIASFARHRPRSTASIVLLTLLTISLLLAAISLIMLIFVINSGNLATWAPPMGSGADRREPTHFRTWQSSALPNVSELVATSQTLHGPWRLFQRPRDIRSASSVTGMGGESTVFVSQTSRIHASRPASFGPHISRSDGKPGWLVPLEEVVLGPDQEATSRRDEEAVKARRGCLGSQDDSLSSGAAHPPPNVAWIALIERGSCSFVSKVRYAQAIGAQAVIVGDWATSAPPSYSVPQTEQDDLGGFRGFGSGLITMYAPGDTSDVRVPSVFVARESYVSLVKDWQDEGVVVQPGEEARSSVSGVRALRVVMSRDELWTWPFLDILIVLLFLPSILTFSTLLLHRIAAFRRRRADRAPREVVEGLPSVIWRKDMEKGIPVMVPTYRLVSGPSEPSGSARSPGEASRERAVIVEAGQPSWWFRRLQPWHFNSSSETTPLLSEPSHWGKRPRRRERRAIAQSICALCLDEFQVEQRVRVLPCGHCFHQGNGATLPDSSHNSDRMMAGTEREECMGVDVWLLRQKRICPICRMSILQSTPPSPLIHPDDRRIDGADVPASPLDIVGYHTARNERGPVASSSRDQGGMRV